MTFILYSEVVLQQPYPELKQFTLLTCDCDCPAKPVVTVSKSIENPERIVFFCNNKKKYHQLKS